MSYQKLRLGIFIGLCCLFLVTPMSPVSKAEPAGNETFQVIGSYKIPAGWNSVPRLLISGDGKKIAYALQTVNVSTRQTTIERTTTTYSSTMLMLNDKAVSPTYFDIENFNFSYNGSNLSYIYSNIKNNRKEFGLNLNGRDLASGFESYPKCTYEKDGAQLIYWQKDDSGYHIMVNSEKAESFPDWLVQEIMSRSKSYAGTYNGVVPGKILVLNKPDGREFIYEVSYNNALVQIKNYVIRNGQKIFEGYEDINRLMVSPDGKNIAWVAKDHIKSFAVLNGQVISPGFTIIDPIDFTPDGTKLIYVGFNWKTSIMINDRQLLADFYKINTIFMNRDGSELTYIANQSLKDFVMVNGRIVSSKFDKIINSVSNRNGKVAYTAFQKGKCFIMTGDRKISPEFPKDQEPEAICFSDDGSKICYKASGGGKQPQQWLMVGERPVTPRFKKLFYRLADDGRVIFAGVDMEKREIVHGTFKPW